MTLNQIYKKGKLILKEAGNQSPAFDCMCILNYCLKIDRHYLIMNGSEIVSKQDGSKFLNAVNKRANGIPLQYIIGKWEFMNLEFKVGEGVLIPREDTQTLVDECLNKILSKKKSENFGSLCWKWSCWYKYSDQKIRFKSYVC